MKIQFFVLLSLVFSTSANCQVVYRKSIPGPFLAAVPDSMFNMSLIELDTLKADGVLLLYENRDFYLPKSIRSMKNEISFLFEERINDTIFNEWSINATFYKDSLVVTTLIDGGATICWNQYINAWKIEEDLFLIKLWLLDEPKQNREFEFFLRLN